MLARKQILKECAHPRTHLDAAPGDLIRNAAVSLRPAAARKKQNDGGEFQHHVNSSCCGWSSTQPRSGRSLKMHPESRPTIHSPRLCGLKKVIQSPMKCPACKRVLKKLKVGPVTLDACQDGCGGIWFDADELGKINATLATGKNPVAEISRTVEVDTGETRVLKCVKCRGATLERKLFSLGSGVIMDCCSKCGGLWLDHSELETIREETNPAPRPVRHIVERKSTSLPINFQLVREVQKLRISVR